RPRARAVRGARHRDPGRLPGAADLRQPFLRKLPPFDAALCLPALRGDARRAGAPGRQMGPPGAAARPPDARSRPAADRPSRRSAVAAICLRLPLPLALIKRLSAADILNRIAAEGRASGCGMTPED